MNYNFKNIKEQKVFKVDAQHFFIARAKAQLTVKELCKKAEVSHKIPDKIVEGRNLQAVTIGKLAKALNVSVEYLLGIEVEK